VVQAQTTTAEETNTVTVNVEASVSTTQEDTSEALEGMEVSTVDKVPTSFGLFWFSLKERINIAFTFDPVKKAEKQVQFAEERMLIASKMSEKTDDPKVQEKIQKMIERAQELITKVEEKKDKFLENKDDRSQRLLKNIAIHTENKEAVMDKIEERLQDKLTPEQLIKFQEMRADGMLKAQGILKAITNPNMPEEVKTKLQEVKDRIDQKAEESKLFRETQKQALEDLKNGVDGAKDELKALYDTRREEMKTNLEEAKIKLEERKEVEKDLRGEAISGDEDAIKKLEMMRANDERLREQLQQRVENREENIVPKIQERTEEMRRLEVERIEKIEEETNQIQENKIEVRQENGSNLEDKIEIENKIEVKVQN